MDINKKIPSFSKLKKGSFLELIIDYSLELIYNK